MIMIEKFFILLTVKNRSDHPFFCWTLVIHAWIIIAHFLRFEDKKNAIHEISEEGKKFIYFTLNSIPKNRHLLLHLYPDKKSKENKMINRKGNKQVFRQKLVELKIGDLLRSVFMCENLKKYIYLHA